MSNWNGQLTHNKYGAGRYCYQCTEREVGCHSKCPKYKKAHQEAKEWNEFVEQKKNEEREINQYKRLTSNKVYKRKRQNTPQ